MTVNNNQVVERELGWDEVISNDGQEFILLPAGDYNFTVKGFERARFEGSAKMPACPMAVVNIGIVDPVSGNEAFIQHRIMLHTKTEWTISAFFESLGLKKKGEKVIPQWNAIAGKTGRCKVVQQEYNSNTYNNIAKFYSAEETSNQPGYQF